MTDPNYYDDDDEIFDRPTCLDYLISLLLFLYFRKCEKKYFNHAFLKGDLKGKNPSCKIQKHFFFCFVCLFHHVQHYYYYLIITKNDIFFSKTNQKDMCHHHHLHHQVGDVLLNIVVMDGGTKRCCFSMYIKKI